MQFSLLGEGEVALVAILSLGDGREASAALFPLKECWQALVAILFLDWWGGVSRIFLFEGGSASVNGNVLFGDW